MQLTILQGDLFRVTCDACAVPAAGSAGSRKAAITSGGELPATYLVHTVCPECAAESGGAYGLLARCCQDLLETVAEKPDIHHLALPLLGTDDGGYRLDAPCYGETPYSLTAVTILSTLISCAPKTLEAVTLVCASEAQCACMQRTYRWICGKGLDQKSRIRGSLLGGAVGDALGYPVEFNDAAHSRIHAYKLDGKTGKALISDDTQMTLFTACGLLCSRSESCTGGERSDPWQQIAFAYDDWLKTQRPHYQKRKPAISWIRDIPQLNQCRAPGITCLSALETGGGSKDHPINNSKGCGGVMRIAPVALYGGAHRHWDQHYNLLCCAEAAAITHGHPLGWLSAAALGNILYDIMLDFSIPYAVQDTILLLEKTFSQFPDTQRMIALLRLAEKLAGEAIAMDAVDLITQCRITQQLGEGWIGEEALAVGLFCAMVGVERGFDLCLWNAVGHQGDSDSTASIAGQIWGAYFGVEAISHKWLQDLELRDVITQIADDLATAGEDHICRDSDWVRKYLPGAANIVPPSQLPPQ